ncbi:hypothetical protein pb186bvf_005810 [Paramecium bursaria]
MNKNTLDRIKGFRLSLTISSFISLPLIYNQIIKQNALNDSKEKIYKNSNTTKEIKLKESEAPTDFINNNDQGYRVILAQIEQTEEQTNSMENYAKKTLSSTDTINNNDQFMEIVSSQIQKTDKLDTYNQNLNPNSQKIEVKIQPESDQSSITKKENGIIDNNFNTDQLIGQQKQSPNVKQGTKIVKNQKILIALIWREQQKYIQFMMNNSQYYLLYKCNLIKLSVEFFIKHPYQYLVSIPEYQKQDMSEKQSNSTESSVSGLKQFHSEQKRDLNQFQQNQDQEIGLDKNVYLSDTTSQQYTSKLQEFETFSDYQKQQAKKKKDLNNMKIDKLQKKIKSRTPYNEDYLIQQKLRNFQDLPKQNQFSDIQLNLNQGDLLNSQDYNQNIQQLNQDDAYEQSITNQPQNLEKSLPDIVLQNQGDQKEILINNIQVELEVDRENQNPLQDQQLQPPQNNDNQSHHKNDINQEYSIMDKKIQKDLNQEVLIQIDNNKDHQIQNQLLMQLEIIKNEAFQILDQKFYLPSFKKRQILDEILKKFVRDFQAVEQYQEEYNLDGTQEQLLKEQIQYFIPIRGDGNCLFTSIGFQYIYYNLIDNQRFQRLLNIIDSTEFKQNNDDKIVETEDEQQILRQEFKNQLQKFVTFEEETQKILQQIAQCINNDEGPFYGLLIIFLRNYFRKILQDFYDNDEMNFLIQNPDQINEIITWEYMYDETDIALKLFAAQEQILIRCYQKMNVDDKAVQISEYKDENQNQFQYKIGLAFQPGHYNAMKLYH